MKHLPFQVLKGCPSLGAFLSRVYLPTGFGGRAGSDMNTSHIFPQGVQAAITLVGCGAGDGGTRARFRHELGLLFCSVAVTLYHAGVRFQVAGAEVLRVVSMLTLFPLSVYSPPSQHHHPCPRAELVHVGLVWVLGMCVGVRQGCSQ